MDLQRRRTESAPDGLGLAGASPNDMAALEGENSELMQRVTVLEGEKLELTQRVNGLLREKSELTRRVKDVEGEKAAHKKQAVGLEGDELTQQVKALEEEAATLRKALSNHTRASLERIAELEQQARRVHAQHG
jgi:predicted  nucleic acid-binding Zn-ribbon protein